MNKQINQKIKQIVDDIKSISIQGATNVALATVEGMKLVRDSGENIQTVINIGEKLANARPNEPMAKNSVKYIKYYLKKGMDISQIIDNYKKLIQKSKLQIKSIGGKILARYKVILTHCHSSTSTAILIEASKLNPNLKVVATETRPRYQGRITSKELFEAGVDVTLITDSASAAFIIDNKYLPVEAVIIGTDELLSDGTILNKVGSYQLAQAAFLGNDDFYVTTSLLKLDIERDSTSIKIEMRDAEEVWLEAPNGLKIINPSFDAIPPKLITGYITEAGLLKPKEVEVMAKKIYPWI